MNNAGIKLVYPRNTNLPEMLPEYKASVVEKVRRHRRPVIILTIPGAEASFVTEGYVAVYLPEFRHEKWYFVAGNNVLEILDLNNIRLERNYLTCPACYRLTGEFWPKFKSDGHKLPYKNEGYVLVRNFRCRICTHEWEVRE